MNRAGNHSCISIIVLDLAQRVLLLCLVALAEHGVRFSRTSLSIGEDSDVIAVHDARHDIDKLTVNVSLRGLAAECVVELDLKLRVLVSCDSNALILGNDPSTSDKTSTT